MKDLERTMKFLQGSAKEPSKDENFYGQFLPLLDRIMMIDRLYDKVRNHMTQKSIEINTGAMIFSIRANTAVITIACRCCNDVLLFKLDNFNFRLYKLFHLLVLHSFDILNTLDLYNDLACFFCYLQCMEHPHSCIVSTGSRQDTYYIQGSNPIFRSFHAISTVSGDPICRRPDCRNYHSHIRVHIDKNCHPAVFRLCVDYPPYID